MHGTAKLQNNEIIRLALCLNKQKKSIDELDYIHQCLRKIPFMKHLISGIKLIGDVNFSDYIHKLCNSFKCEQAEPNQIVFTQGDINDAKFYFMLKGEVSVFKHPTIAKVSSDYKTDHYYKKRLCALEKLDREREAKNKKFEQITNRPNLLGEDSKNDSNILSVNMGRFMKNQYGMTSDKQKLSISSKNILNSIQLAKTKRLPTSIPKFSFPETLKN